ncbi:MULTISPECIES: hypothetical protein [unclassified Corallococcus]|uniref:hypothetical protein n=1 Tax=unclassified Corallococcus TaxID=2685029 RepID=UPI001A8DCB1F|nr:MULTISPECIES: hypothetical protein [unclassified Corallococcus]MBN9683983.1 hypothetical protein [Corallococcus sp. NCSPR001]WAS84520.1 hypothetical protein O0N60_35265 [Corallococcus sp. NCRR]
MVMFVHLGNAAAVSARNTRLSNLLNVLRTLAADNVRSAWGEQGYDIAPWLGLDGNHRLEPSVRIDSMDSQLKPRPELFTSHFERTPYTGGTSYTLAGLAALRPNFSQRRLPFGERAPEVDGLCLRIRPSAISIVVATRGIEGSPLASRSLETLPAGGWRAPDGRLWR